MRHSIGGMWLLQLMVLFIFLFAAYIILTLNYSKTIKIKNEVVSMIEKYEGLNDASLELVNNYLTTAGYSTLGVCSTKEQSGIYGANDLFSTSLEEAVPGEKYYYCVKKYRGTNLTNYYQVALFYKFNLPVIGETSHFNVKGTTSNFHSVDDEDYCYTIDGTCGHSNTNRPNSGGSIYDQTYIVSFNLNGGNGSISSQTVSRGNKAKKPSIPTRNGYSFAGWRLNGKIYTFNESVYENITLVAQWISNSSSDLKLVTVTFDLNGGTAIKNDGHSQNIVNIPSQTLNAGDYATKPDNPYNYSIPSDAQGGYYIGYSGWTFDGWTLNGNIYDFNTPVTSNIVLKARWVRQIKVSFVYGYCGMTEYNEDKNKSNNSAGAAGTYKFSKAHLYNPGDIIGNNVTFGQGAKYDDNKWNHEYNYVYTFGTAKPIKYWTLNGSRYNLNTPVTKDITLEAVCD